MSYTLKVLDPPVADQPENPLMRTKRTYTYYNDIDIPSITYKTDNSGNSTANVVWNIKGSGNGYMCINIPIVAYLMNNGVTIDTIKPD